MDSQKLLGMKYDGGKPEYDLVPSRALEETVNVLTFGAKKYAPDNWKYVANGKRRYFSAAMRHMWVWFRGEKTDPETGLNHLAHAMCCLMFLLEKDLDNAWDGEEPKMPAK